MGLEETKASGTLISRIAEYVAASKAVAQAIWLRRILDDIRHEQKHSTIIYCDNKSTIDIARNPVSQDTIKHIAIKYHFIREAVEDRVVKLANDQEANIFTKALSKNKFISLRQQLGVTGKCMH